MSFHESGNEDTTLVAPACGPAAQELVPSFVAKARQQPDDPVIARFRTALQRVQAHELERLYDRLPELDNGSRLAIRQFADSLVAKMLYPPLKSLHDESHRGSRQRLLDALQRLFQLRD